MLLQRECHKIWGHITEKEIEVNSSIWESAVLDKRFQYFAYASYQTRLFHTAFQSTPRHRCKCQELCSTLHFDRDWCRRLNSNEIKRMMSMLYINELFYLHFLQYSPVSHCLPVHPTAHVQLLGAVQFPPFWQGLVQLAAVGEGDMIVHEQKKIIKEQQNSSVNNTRYNNKPTYIYDCTFTCTFYNIHLFHTAFQSIPQHMYNC